MQVCSSPFPSPPVGAAASASTSSNCRWPAPATTSCRCISISRPVASGWSPPSGPPSRGLACGVSAVAVLKRNFLASVLRDVGLPDVLASGPRRALHGRLPDGPARSGARRDAAPRLAAPPQHRRQGRRINGVVADVLPAGRTCSCCCCCCSMMLLLLPMSCAPLRAIDATTGRTSCRSLSSP